ncbi:STAS/SEC14 domain-containing protein [Pontibacter vulgaris]|uniref:STAS/SEC14 domain-containing protein n=1 Tax=Pontibacter vulgaris TaxID=2905679 RepID=UPI001FA6F60A|nr:STAS/SEC14 domain-containing protein [Pontibacter vulgaris]
MVFTYFQNHVVTILYDDELQLGTAIWNGFLSSEEFKEAVSACLQLMEEYKALRWLGDNRKLRAIRQSDQEWFVEYAFPRLAAGTLRRNATVVSEDVFNKMAVEQLIKRADNLGDMVIKEFDSVEDAIAWLNEPISFQDKE